MAFKCDLCAKKTERGGQHTHHTGVAGGQWKKRATITPRRFRPNLHWITMPFNGILTRVRACTKCIKRNKFDLKKTSAQVA